MKSFTKESLAADLRAIREKGWIQSARQGNDGGVGNISMRRLLCKCTSPKTFDMVKFLL